MNLIQQIILDLARKKAAIGNQRKKIYSPEGKRIGPQGGRFDYLDEIENKFSSKIGIKSKWDEINKGMLKESSVFHTTVDDPNYHPEKTSINSSKLPSGMRNALDKGFIPEGATVLDYGGGKFDNGKREVESRVGGATMHILDPYARTKEHNDKVASLLSGKKADVVMNHNVLNVIQDPIERQEVIQGAYAFVKPGGQLHISVYVGDGTGSGKKVMHGKSGGWNWQENRKTADYIPEIQSSIPDAQLISKSNGLLVFKKPEGKSP